LRVAARKSSIYVAVCPEAAVRCDAAIFPGARSFSLCALRAREAAPSGAANPARALDRAAADFLFGKLAKRAVALETAR